MKIPHILFYPTLLYFIGLLYCELIITQAVNLKLQEVITIMKISANMGHEAFAACEAGKLKEFRLEKRAEFYKRAGAK